MNVFILSPAVPTKSGRGFEIILYKRIKKMLELNYKVHLCVVSHKLNYFDTNLISDDNFSYESHVISYFSLFFSFLNIFRFWPLQVCFYYCFYVHQKIKKSINYKKSDIVISYLIRTSQYVTDKDNKKCVLEAVDSMSLNFSRKVSRNPIINLIYFIETKLCYFYEKRLKFDSIITVASQDSSFFNCSDVEILPIGVDTNPELIPKLPGKPSLIFTGNFFYSPNVDSLLWFVNNIFVHLLTVFPEIKLHIVGRESNVIKLNVNNIVIHGSVDNLHSYIKAADISIAPMVSGSGMQFKILEAMSIGCPVITSKIGLGDIKAIPNFNILIADCLNSYIHAISKLMIENDLAKNASVFIDNEHQWDKLNDEFINIINK